MPRAASFALLARVTLTAGILTAGATLATLALAACGKPPELRPRPGSSVPRPAEEPSPSLGPIPPSDGLLPPGQTATASPTPSFAEEVAVGCGGFPSGNQVVALVRRSGGGLLPPNATATVTTGPLCAGSWQYTIIAAPGQERLVVVTEGGPANLRLVTAGTDVCTIRVRTAAPVGIRDAARCPAPGG